MNKNKVCALIIINVKVTGIAINYWVVNVQMAFALKKGGVPRKSHLKQKLTISIPMCLQFGSKVQ